jgi:hypothetical protein
MKTRRLSDREIMCLAIDYMPADVARKFIQFIETTDFDADDGDAGPTIDPYHGKLCCLLLAAEYSTQH